MYVHKHMHPVKNEHQIKFCFTYQYLGNQKKIKKLESLPFFCL